MGKAKLVIVDDNRTELKGITKMLSAISSVTIIATLSDGEEAYKFLKENDADILITDIQMPGMTGLELIERLRKENNEIRVIAISSYGEFSYAQKAIDLDVEKYILKPINKKEFVVHVEELAWRIIEKANDNQTMLSYNSKLLCQHLLFGTTEEKASALIKLKEYFLKGGYTVYCVMTIRFTDIKLHETVLLAKKETEEILEFISKDNMDLYKFSDRLEQINCILMVKKEEEIEGFLNILSENIKKIASKHHLYIDVGVSKQASNLENIFEYYQQSVKSAVIYNENSSINCYASISSDVPKIDLIDAQKSIESIINGDLDEIDGFVDKLLPTQKIYSRSDVRNIYEIVVSITELEVEKNNKSLKTEIGAELYDVILNYEKIVNVSQWLKNFLFLSSNLFVSKRKDRYDIIVEDIQKYINENFEKKITVYGLADMFGISKSTLSKIFLERTGIDVKDYILSVRMENAKRMLTERDAKIYLVSEMVGFKKRTQFYTKFTQYTGMKPSEYIKKFGNRL